MITQNKSDVFCESDEYYMPEFGLYETNIPSSCLEHPLEKEWEKTKIETQKGLIDAKTLVDQFKVLVNENEALKKRIFKIEDELSGKNNFVGVNNLMFSHDIIDEIWDEDDDSL